MHPTDRIENLRLFYYIAPSNRSEVTAAPVMEHTEYVELITRGGVFYGDQYHGPGTMFWHFPGETTIHRYKQESPYECLAALFTIKGPHKQIAPPVILWNAQRELQKFVDESLRAFHDDSYDRELLAYTVHARLLSAAYNAARIQPPTGTPKLLEQALSLLDRGYHNPDLNIATLAEELCISIPHLHMLFRKHLGETPHQRLLARRLQEARNLLATSNQNLKELAFECGFANVEHFCRIFKERFGMTPGEYRRRNTPETITNG